MPVLPPMTGVAEALRQNLNALVVEGMGTYQQMYSLIADTKQSGTLVELYPTLRRNPSLSPWDGGDRDSTSLSFDLREVFNEDHQALIAVKESEMDDLSAIMALAQVGQGWGRSAAEWPDAALYRTALYSNDLVGPADQPFFHTDHPLLSARGLVATYSNVATKRLNAASFAAAEASFGLVYSRLRAMQDSEGMPYSTIMGGTLKLIVSPQYEATAEIICNQMQLVNQDINPYYKKAEVLVNPYTPPGYEHHWLLANVGYIHKPFFWQIRKPPTVTVEHKITKQVYNLGIDGRGAVGCTDPQLVIRSDGTVA